MGKFLYWMNVSLDLRIEQVPGDNGAGEWLHIDDEVHAEFNARAKALAGMVQGRVMYEIMDPFWPDARDDESHPAVIREYGRIWTDAPKWLVSRTRSSAEHSTRVINDFAELETLRAETDGVIGVGGADVATQLLRAGLLDELLLFVHPSYLGFGRPLFDDYERPLDLELLETKSFGSGVVMNPYAIAKEN